MDRSKPSTLRRLLWFAALWAAGVLAVGAVGLAVKLFLSA